SFFDERTGLKGSSVRAIARYANSLYAGTGTGLYRLQRGAAGAFARFEQNESLKDEILSLLSTEAGLLIGAGGGVHELRGNVIRTVYVARSTYDLTRSRRDPALVYASSRNGLALLREKGGRWSEAGKIPGVTQNLRKVAEDSTGRLWLGTDYEGALRVD